IDNLQMSIDADTIIQAALFHDMGNIIKSDLSLFPEFLEPEGLAYWENVKKEYIIKYGTDEHVATINVTKEIGLDVGAIKLIETMSFGKMLQIRDGEDFGIKILEYADMRVVPRGIAGIAERLREGRIRYSGREGGFNYERYTELSSALQDIENDILSRSKIKPEDITNESVQNNIQSFQNYSLDC
ncbi:MAG: hypothetical protein Q7S86_00805, partial [bacterium]|nr:hypothetical protein [bacterium]